MLEQPLVEGDELAHAEVLARFLRRALKGEAAAGEHQELIHEVRIFDHVRGADDGAAAIRDIAQQLHERELRGRIEPGGGLIEKQNRRAHEQLHAHADALALAAGEAADRQLGAMADAELLHRLHQQALDLPGAAWCAAGAAARCSAAPAGR